MKAYIYTVILGLLGFGVASAQTSIKEIREEVMDVELLKNWKTGETKTIKDQSITKIKDNGDGATRTNLMYMPPSRSLFMHPTLLTMPVEVPKAGTLYIMVDRESEAAANASNYTIQIFDKTGVVELAITNPDEQPGKVFKYGIWYNHFSVEVPSYAGTEFIVQVTDNTSHKSVSYYVDSNEEKNTIEMEKRLAGR